MARRLLAAALAAATAPATLAATVPVTAIAAHAAASEVRTTDGWTNVRSGPGTSYSVVRVLAPGTRITGEVTNGWQQIAPSQWVSTYVTSPVTTTDPGETEVRWTTTTVNVRSGPGLGYAIVGRLAEGTRMEGRVVNGWQEIGTDRWVSTYVSTPVDPNPTDPTPGDSQVRTTNGWTNMRSGPGTSYSVVRVLAPGTRLEGPVIDGWQMVAEGQWVSAAVTTRVDDGGSPEPAGEDLVRWTTTNVNVRGGAGLDQPIVGRLAAGTRLVGPVVDGWQYIGNGRWVSTYVSEVRAAQRINHWGDGTRKVAYLTYDDGPNPTWTPQVLEVLERHDVAATFFVVGEWATRYPQLVQQTRDAGHVVTNHSYTHPELWDLGNAEIRTELNRTNDVIGETRCYRPPYGAVTQRVDAAAGEAGSQWSVMWNAGGDDWQRPGAKAIADKIVHEMTPGGIALMHDGGGDRSQTVAATEDIISRLKAKGYTFEALPMC